LLVASLFFPIYYLALSLWLEFGKRRSMAKASAKAGPYQTGSGG
jgi:hypothetical protein